MRNKFKNEKLNVGAGCHPCTERNKGITLIALIITIIIMLILVAVTIDIAVDGKLFDKAQEAVDKTNDKVGQTQDRIDEWMGKLDKEPEEEQVPEPEEPVIVEPENIEDWEYEPEDDGTLRITGYLGSDTDVVVPNSIDGVPVSVVGRVIGTAYLMQEISIWDSSITDSKVLLSGSSLILANSSIKSVEVSPGIVEIGDYAFAGSVGVEKFDIPDSVEYIGSSAFLECNSLTEITVPDGIMAIGDRAFKNCYSLAEITIPDKVKTVGNEVFLGCTITVNVQWKEGEKPDGWDDNWNNAGSSGAVTVNYAE